MSTSPPEILSAVPEEFSRQRLEVLVEVAEELETTMPEIAGITAFGSAVRGEARADSDVDLYLFVEPTDNPGSFQANSKVKDSDRIQKLGEDRPLKGTYVFHQAVDLDYKFTIMKLVKQKGNFEADIIVCPIDEAIVNDQIDDILSSAEALDKSDGQVKEVTPRNIRGLFHVPIADAGIKKYQEQVLKRLASSQYGQLAWKMIRHAVIGFEQGKDGGYDENPHREVPVTLDEALDYYAVTTRQ